jgi:peptide/nickel transport system permease protein
MTPALRAAPRRIGTTLLTLWLVSVVVFFATQTLPGDAAHAILGREATPARVAALREQLHLTGSPLEQYWHWLTSVVRLQFGKSLSNGAPVMEFLGGRIGNSLLLMVGAALIGVPIALLVGALSGYRRDGPIDNASSVVTLVLAALPEFVIASGLVILLSTGLWKFLPATSTDTPVADHLNELVLPCLSLGLAIAPYILRMMRAAMIEVFESDYVEHARLSGASERSVVLRHAVPNAIGAVAQVTALQLAYLAGGVVVVEYVFGFPGVGIALVDAVTNRDLPVIQATCLFIALFYIVVNLLADAITGLANPRTRHAAA